MMHHSPSFSGASMSASTSSHHNPGLSPRGNTNPGGPLTSSFSDSMTLAQQPRAQYTSGYLMSASQNNNAPQGNQRVDELPVVQTKAKMNHILSRGSAPDFGMDSMFQSSSGHRQRQTFADEDAPPMSSIHDIPNEVASESSSGRFQTKQTGNEKSYLSSSRRQNTAPQPAAPDLFQPIYVIVFGYPQEKYNQTVEHFRKLGLSTDAEQHKDIVNCFKLGYHVAGDALRAVRKNGDVVGGSWMVGVKWADPIQAETLLGQNVRSPLPSSISMNQNHTDFGDESNAMSVDEPSLPQSNSGGPPMIGTPVKLAPSMAAFRKAPGVSASSSKPSTPQQAKWGSGLLSTPVNTPGQNNASNASPAIQPSPSKGVISQMSDIIFGW